MRVESAGAYGERALSAALDRSALTPQDRGLVTELVYGTLRQGPALEAALGAHLSQPLQRLPIPVRCALRLGAYQLLHLRVPAHSAVNESVKLVGARYGRLLGLVNAVLRKLALDAEAQAEAGVAAPGAPALAQPQPEAAPGAEVDADAAADAAPPPAAASLEARAARAAHPGWYLEHLERTLGQLEAAQAVAAHNAKPPLSLRANVRRCTRDALLARLAEAGLRPEPSPHLDVGILLPPSGAIPALPGFAEGHFVVQDMAAAAVGLMLSPPSGTDVLDVCAAPGGKATHLLELMRGRGRVLAVDRHAGRLRLVAANAERLGHRGISTYPIDAAQPGALAQALATLGRTQATHVLLDAPCSAMGTLRRHPELRRATVDRVERLAQQQAALLDATAEIVAPGGVLVYAVCTTLPEEGPEQVDAFLARHPSFALEAPPAAVQHLCDGMALRTWPHRDNLDGFFAVRLRRAPTPSPGEASSRTPDGAAAATAGSLLPAPAAR